VLKVHSAQNRALDYSEYKSNYPLLIELLQGDKKQYCYRFESDQGEQKETKLYVFGMDQGNHSNILFKE
jgi:hypothetical protein